MNDRIRFISHEGKKILLIDFSNCSAGEVEEVCRGVPEIVTKLPRNSVLILSDFESMSRARHAMEGITTVASNCPLLTPSRPVFVTPSQRVNRAFSHCARAALGRLANASLAPIAMASFWQTTARM